MLGEKNPFKEPAAKPGGGEASSRTAWIIAGALGVLSIVALLLWATAVGHLRETEPLSAKLADANARLKSALDAAQQDKDQISTLEARVAELQQEVEKAAQATKGLENEMRSDLESKDVTISQLQGKLTVNILDRVMFDSGEAILKPAGESVLRKLATIIAAHPELKIQVIGHTDNVPIRNRFASNWELSTARALSAVHFMTENAGIDPRRVGAAGYGEFRPIADNATAEGRAKNRRIAITIIPDELAAADAVPPMKPIAPVNPKPQPSASDSPDTAVK